MLLLDITMRFMPRRTPGPRRPACAVVRGLSLAVLLCASLGLGSGPSHATPLFALQESDDCDACHDGGRSQRPVLERRCTLDCQGCHVDPAGAGPRNQWGYYYSQADLPSFTFFKPQDPLEDTSRFDAHYDGRIIKRHHDGEERTFPMSSEFSLRFRPYVKYLHFTYQALFFGRIGDDTFRADRSDSRRFREKYAAMIDALPLNTYVRAYRGQPMYGLRRTNHTVWIRERLGLDQFAMTEAVEVGTTPNVPFFRASYMQGSPYKELEDRQKGLSFHGGLRGVTLGWHLNASLWQTNSKKAAVNMHAIGAGLSPWDFVVYGERNWREVSKFEDPPGERNFESRMLRLHPSSRIDYAKFAYTGIPGISTGGVYEELHDPTANRFRQSVFADFHPIPWVQFEIWRRFETGARDLVDTLATLHLYADF